MFISIGIDENGKPFVSTSDKMEKPSRPNKGRSLIAIPDTYTVIDIETTGLDSRFCEIIELSALRYSNGSLIDSFTTLVKPTEPIDDFITELTGITNDLVSDAPAISDAIKNFYNFVGSDILVGYNVHFDINFIYDVLQNTHGLDFTNSFVDVMRFAKKLLPDLKNHKLETVADHYKISSPAHRSYADCETCNACYQALLSDAIAQYGDFETLSLVGSIYIIYLCCSGSSHTSAPLSQCFFLSCCFLGMCFRLYSCYRSALRCCLPYTVRHSSQGRTAYMYNQSKQIRP